MRAADVDPRQPGRAVRLPPMTRTSQGTDAGLRAPRIRLAECYVFGLFSYGHLAFFYAVAAFLGAYESWKSYLVIVAGAMAFLAWGLVGFYRTRPWRAALAALFMAPAYYVVGGMMGRLVAELLRRW